MVWKGWKNSSSRVVNIYELAVWLIYAGIFKYEHYLEVRKIYAGAPKIDYQLDPYFPLPEVCLYAIAMTLYVIPFYRLIAPALLQKKKYFVLFLSVLAYFIIVPKLTNWTVSGIFLHLTSNDICRHLYTGEHRFYTFVISSIGGEDFQLLLTDIVAFLSITFMRFAFDNERKKYMLERDNLVLQLESLKAQLHPHFLFNTLNSIYGMSLTGSPETPDYILKLSDMMRFILYDCRKNKVPLEKDIEFLENYITMEKKRYPIAHIEFKTTGDPENIQVAPLLFIPFIENSFKHGAHRISDNGNVKGHLTVEKDKLQFVLENDVLPATQPKTAYGGVGIENVRRRLELYYPGQYKLNINNDQRLFTIELTIQLKH